MKILILGGTGFFGKDYANLAHAAGNEVTIFSRRAPVDGLHVDIKQKRGDRTVEIDLERMAVDTWDIIVDNICYTADDAIKAVKAFNGRCGLYLFTSSSSVYSTLEGATTPYREIQTELLPKKAELPGKPYYAYALGKSEAETVFLHAFKTVKFPVTIIRPPVVIGPRDPSLRAYSYWLRIADGGQVFAPGFAFKNSYIFSRDLARAIEKVAASPGTAGQVYNFADSHRITLEDFLKLSARIMHKEPRLLFPDRAWLKENAFDFDASPLSGGGDFTLDTDKAVKAFDWESTPVHEWLKETIDWFIFKYTGPAPKNYASRKRELELAEAWLSRR